MRSTFSILPYINRNKVKADGTTAVLCRITIDGKSSTMATGIYCRPENWNSKTGAIRTVRENNRLQEFRKSVELAYDEILKKQNVVSAELLKNTLAKRTVVPTKLLQMGERELERLLARSKEINSTSTYRNSKYYQKYLADFLVSMGKTDMDFTDITENFGSSYKAFLKRYKNFGPSQTNKCLCWLSKLVYLAVDYEILRANPLEDMEYEKKPAPKHRHISRAELKAISLKPRCSTRCRNWGAGRSCFQRSPVWRMWTPCCSIRTTSARLPTEGVTSASTERRPMWRRSSPCTR